MSINGNRITQGGSMSDGMSDAHKSKSKERADKQTRALADNMLELGVITVMLLEKWEERKKLEHYKWNI